MKTKLFLSLFAAAATCGLASAAETAYTTPVGYTTQTLSPGFTLTGLTLHSPTVAAGEFTSFTATSLTDSGQSFVVTSTKNYILEMKDTSGVSGMVIEVPGTAFAGDTISGFSGITADYLGGYIIRESATFSSVFGSGPTCILKKGTSTTADVVFVPDGLGGFLSYFHTADQTVPFPVVGKWQLVGGGSTDRALTPINYLDALYVQVRGPAVTWTLSGEVKLDETLLPIPNGFTYTSSIFPVGSTLGSSGLADSVLKGTSTTADLIFMPNGLGGFDTFFHTADQTVPFPVTGKWQKVGGGSTDQATAPIQTGIIVQRRGASTNMPYSPPASYSNL